MKTSLRLPLVALSGLALAPLLRAGTISAETYANSFTASAADFATANPGSGAWVLDTSGTGTFGHADAGSVSGTYTASVQHTLLGGSADTARDFTFGATTDYTSTGVASGNTLGVAFLNTASSLANTTGYALYIRGVANPNDVTGKSVFLMRNNVAVDSDGGQASEMRDYFGHGFSYQITGTYIDAVGSDGIKDSLSISAVFTNLTNSVSFSLTYIDNAPLTGNHFGLRAEDFSGSAGLTSQWDTFSLTVAPVPEPSSTAALFGLATLGLVTLRRRRRA